MDIQKESSRTKKVLRRIGLTAIAGTIVVGLMAGFSRLEPAAPLVEKASIWTGVVERGDMVRRVRGTGSLVPINIRWITPDTQGRVERVLVQPGAKVASDTVILELSNQELELAVEEAKLKLKSAEAELAAKKVEFEHDLLNLQTSAARLEADHVEAELRAKSDKELAEDGLIPELQLEVSTVRARELEKLKGIEQKRVDVQKEYSETLLRVLTAKMDQASALYELKQRQLKSLRVRARFDGILEQLLVEVGQQVTTSSNLAKVSDPKDLKAVLRIDQNQVREVRIGQLVEVDLRNTVLPGHVTRIDPSVQQGTVNVDVALDDSLPSGARPDQSLDGTVEIEKLTDVLYVDRPVYSQAQSTLGLFRLSTDGQTASRTRVTFGQSSVNSMEVRAGLSEGDTIILTDMSTWDKADKIRLR